MINGTFILFALALGYAVSVGLLMLATFGMTKASPEFVVQDHILKPGYRFVQEALWLICTTAGGYASAWLAGLTTHPWFVAVTLISILLVILWSNTWEMAQRGLGHQMVMSAVTIAGVCIGFILRLK